MKPILQGMAFIVVVALVAFLVVDRSGLRRSAQTVTMPTATTQTATTQTAATQTAATQGRAGVGGQTAQGSSSPAASGQTTAGQTGSGRAGTGQAGSAGPSAAGSTGSGQAGLGQMNGGQTASAPAQTQGTQAQNTQTQGMPASATGPAAGQAGSVPAAGDGTTSLKVGDQTLTGRAEVGNAVYIRNCLSCHNRDGQAYIPQYPRLSAQIAPYTATQLTLFRAGERRNTAMNQVAARLNDQEIADLAAYLAAAPVPNPWASRNAALRTQGQTLYTQGHPQTGVTACAGCHGPQGAGNAAAGFPRVAGQSPAYFTTRIAELAALAGRTDLPATTLTMAKIARAMTPQETRQLDEYIKTLR